MVETTTIAGKVILPGGNPVTKGTIVATLNRSGSSPDTVTGESQRVGGRFTGTIGADGSVLGLALVPNDAITPSGTFYNVKVYAIAPTKTTWSERWNITTAPDPIDIGAILEPV